MSEHVTAVSVDLDGLSCYHAIHGLPPPRETERDIVLQRCLPRFLEVFDELGVKATFFVIGADALRELDDAGSGAKWLRTAVREGHELGNHSHAHAYDLVRWTPEAIAADLKACDDVLRELGADPEGFRAPGYTHDRALLEQVASLGYRYDSSALPSPPYYVTKLAALAWIRLWGRTSRSVATGAKSFFGPTTPYRRSDVDLWEFPMSVERWLRLPLIGTTLCAGPEPLAAMLRRSAMRADYFHLELHGIDLSDPDADGYAPALLRRQLELRVPLCVKRRRLEELLARRGPVTRLRDLVPA